MLRVIYSIYDKAKSCVKSTQGLSTYFASATGVRQCENLSPILFSVFLNDLVEHISNTYNGLDLLSQSIKNVLSDDIVEVFFKLILLLYADDTVIFAESASDFQLALDVMSTYCELWKLQVNTAKN
jgi:hypothetical protein